MSDTKLSSVDRVRQHRKVLHIREEKKPDFKPPMTCGHIKKRKGYGIKSRQKIRSGAPETAECHLCQHSGNSAPKITPDAMLYIPSFLLVGSRRGACGLSRTLPSNIIVQACALEWSQPKYAVDAHQEVKVIHAI